MKFNTKALPFALTFAEQTNARSFLRLSLTRTNQPRALVSHTPESLSYLRTNPAEPAVLSAGPLSVYAVDDVPCLTELYSSLLGARGYQVKTFINRTAALAALKADRNKPGLLITDYLGPSISVHEFIRACHSVHPSVRILMISGFNQNEIDLSGVRLDGFIQKPFTPEEFYQAVKVVLDLSGRNSNNRHR